MVKHTAFVIALCVLVVLSGCMEANPVHSENTTNPTNTIPAHTDTSSPSAEVEMICEEIITTQGTVSETHSSTDTEDISDQTTTIQSELELFEYDVKIGESWYTVRNHVKNNILLEHQCTCVFWRDAKGYKIALTGNSGDSICAVVIFSEDLKLLETIGVELINQIEDAEQENWIGKKEADFIAQYGPCHFQLGSGGYVPCYIAETGTVYWLSFDDANRDVITKIKSFSINDLTYMYPPEYFPQVIDALQECGLPTELAPQRIPYGYTVDYISRAFIMDRVIVDVKLKNQQDHRIVVSVEKCSESFQFDEELREIRASATQAFSICGRTFYFSEQKDGWSGVWTDGSYRVSLDGFETVEDLQDTIRSMKEQ